MLRGEEGALDDGRTAEAAAIDDSRQAQSKTALNEGRQEGAGREEKSQ